MCPCRGSSTSTRRSSDALPIDPRADGHRVPAKESDAMKFGVLGTGMVGETIGAKLVERGHEVKIGSRSATNEKALAWAGKAGKGSSVGTFADAAAFGEVVFVCTKGEA